MSSPRSRTGSVFLPTSLNLKSNSTSTQKPLIQPVEEPVPKPVPLNYRHPGHIYSNEEDINDPVVIQLQKLRKMIYRREVAKSF